MNSEGHASKTSLAVVSIWVEDVPAAEKFYRDVLGLHLLTQHGVRPHFRVGDTYLVILQGTPVAAKNSVPERFPILALRVDSLDAALERLHAYQIAIPWGIETDGHSRWVMFYDTGGNLIELVQFQP
jgi:catechol-2,3-dioxygenase